MNSKCILFPLRTLLVAASFFLGSQPASAQEVGTAAPAKEEDAKPMLRIICASGSAAGQQAELASKKGNGQWNRLSGMQLKDSMVSEWLPSLHGELHVLLKRNNKAVSACHFTHPADISRILVILTAGDGGDNLRATVIHPEKEGFAAGSTMIVNVSKTTGIVTLGKDTHTVEAGRNLLTKVVTDADGGFGMSVHYPGEDGAQQLCYDKRRTSNPSARHFVVLFPDPNLIMGVISLSEFGPFE